MRWSNLVVPGMALLAGVACVAALAQTPSYNLGRTPSAEEIRAWDISVGPEGKELPAGSGTAQEGAKIYAQRCAQCHGPTATEGKFRRGNALEGYPPAVEERIHSDSALGSSADFWRP